MPKIRQIWDLFVQAESSSYEKSSWCDLLLSQFIVDLNDGHSVSDILTFCNWSALGTLIGCELLSDIDQVCSEPGDGEDLRPLRHHLYTRGWRALTVLLSLGDQNLSCSNELSNLLISLFPVCLETKENHLKYLKTRNKYLLLKKDNEDNELSLAKSLFRSKFSGVHGQMVPKTEFFRTFGPRNKKVHRGGDQHRCCRDPQSSESENPCDEFIDVNKSCALKITLDPMDFDYFTSVVRSDDDSRLNSVLYEPKRRHRNLKKIVPVDFIDEKIKDVMQSQVSPYEFSMLVIQLLTSLCRSERSFTLATENPFPVCLKSVKFALENLCSIQFGSMSNQILDSKETANLKSSLTELLVISLEKVMGCPNVTTNVILTGILPMMLRVLEDSVCKLTTKIYSTEIYDESEESYEREKQQNVIFELICSVITFLLTFLMQNSYVDRIGNFLELFKIFIEKNSGKLIEKTVIALSMFGNTVKAREVINLIGQLITSLKKIRKELINPHLCRKLKHKKCKSEDDLHHHHDLFGAVFTIPVMGSNFQQNCCISSLFLVLVKLLKKSDEISFDILNRTLKVMASCGTCCCFPTNTLFQSLTHVIKLPSHKSRILVFHLLENTLYHELGSYSSQISDRFTCGICLKFSVKDGRNQSQIFTNEDTNSEMEMTIDNGNIENEKTLPSEDPAFYNDTLSERLILKLDLFRDLLLCTDYRIVQDVTCHLLKCAPKMNQSATYSVLFNVFLPTFLTSKMQFLSERDDVSVFRILSSLSIFSLLLNNFTFAEQFVNQKALNHVLDLISFSTFTRHCCLVLEKTIIMVAVIPEIDFETMPSLSILRKTVNEANAMFFTYFEVSNKLSEKDIQLLTHATGLKRNLSNDKKENENENDYEKDKKMFDVLENVAIFWRTYANLTLFSPMLRKFFSKECFLNDCNSLLRIALSCLTKNAFAFAKERNWRSRDNSEACLFTKLMESLLTFLLATSDDHKDGDRGNKVLMEQLTQSLLVSDLQNVDVRRLAEVLLKCSLVQPSQYLVIPSASAPKLLVPPLWRSWENVGEMDENEGRVVSDSESLEDNYFTADEGYEADVEIRDHFASTGEIVYPYSACTVTNSIAFFSAYENEYDKATQKSEHLIVHPKLCLLAIDLLIKLYKEKSVELLSKCSENKRINNYSAQKNLNLIKPFVIGKQEQEKINKVKDVCVHQSLNLIGKRISIDKLTVEETRPDKSQTEYKTENENLEITGKDPEEKFYIGLISVFQRLVSLCKDKIQNCIILCKNSVIIKLLKGFQTCFLDKNECLSELQKAILDLITVLANQSITPDELSFYLGFFKHDNPPVDHLLNPLLTLVTSHSPQPNYTFRFPVSVPNNFIHNSIADLGKTIHLQHKNKGLHSCWSSSALSIPIRADLNWTVWGQGFSLSLWLKADSYYQKFPVQNLKPRVLVKPYRKISKSESVSACSLAASGNSEIHSNDSMRRTVPTSPLKAFSPQDLLHVFSIGNETLTLECWIIPNTNTFIWKLSKVDVQKGYETLAQNTSEHCFSLSTWNHIAINVKDSVIRKKIIIEITLIVNGGPKILIPLSFTGVLMRKYRPSSLLLGAQNNVIKGSYFLSNIMLFSSPIFSREQAVYLLGLGPNRTNLTDCEIGRRSPNFTSVFALKTLTREIDWESVLDAKQGILRKAQNHLIIAYSAENPHSFNVYPSGSGTGSSLFTGFLSPPSEPVPAQHFSVPVDPCIFAALDQQKYHGLIPSSIILGGSATFLFLFARVVELSSSPDEQAKSLYLLLKLIQSDCDLFSQFVANDHHNMLHKVFVSSKCTSGVHILKAILDVCCDKPVLLNNGGEFQIIQQTDAIIVNSFLISTVLNSCKDWSSSVQENQVLRIFFLALRTLLKDEHPFREFNADQLNRVEFVNSLLSFCKERLLCDDKKTLEPEVCNSLVELVKALMGAPPEFSHIVAVMDCLILLHPVTSTYITHVKSSFYILLSAGQTYCSQGKNYENLKNHTGDHDSSHGSPQILDNWIFNLNFDTQMKKLSKLNSTQTIDSNKLNKALTNMQLKHSAVEMGKKEARFRYRNEVVDSNRYSEHLIFNSGIAESCRQPTENLEENDEIIVKAVDGSQQNLNSLFPGTFTGSDRKANSFPEVSNEGEKYTFLEKKKRDIEMHEGCGPQCVVVEGLLLLLRDIILVLPDSMAEQVLNHVVKLETLLVMANHKDHRVRSAIIKVFSSHFQRSSGEEINKFIKLRGFYHLANQISLFPASQSLVEDCIQLLTQRSAYLDAVPLEDHNFLCQQELTYFSLSCLPLLLALLPRSVHDLPQARNLINVIRIFYCKDEYASKTLLENGLLETLVKTLVASAHFSSCDGGEGSQQDLVLLDVVQFFIIIINQALSTAGLTNMQIVSDIHLELNYIYRLEKENCGVKSRCVRVIRDTLCKVLEKALNTMHNKIIRMQSTQKSRASIFSSVLSGVHQEQCNPNRQSSPQNYMNGFGTSSSVLNFQYGLKEISRSELSERFKTLVINAVEFFMFVTETTDGRYSLQSLTELNFIYQLFPMLLQTLSSTLEKRSLGRRQPYSGIFWTIRDTLKVETSEFLVWLLSPRQSLKTRMFTVLTLMSQSNSQNLLSVLLQMPNQIEKKFTIYIWDLMYNNTLSSADLRSCLELKESIQQWGIVSPHSIGNSNDAWGDNCNVLMSEADKEKSSWEKQMEATTMRCVTKYDGLVKIMSDDALTMTRLVVDAQNTERKSFMEEMKLRYSETIQISLKWSQLIGNLTHEKSVWFFEKSYPVFWQLDPTEGPSRVRKRLTRCHIRIEEKYFMSYQRQKLNNENSMEEPLSFLFEDDKKNCTSMILIERLHCNEKIRVMFPAKIVTPATEIPGELLVGETCIYFVADDRHKFQTIDTINTAWLFEEVKEIHSRRYELQERAIEIFLINGKTYLIAFETSKERDALLTELSECDLPNRVTGGNLVDVMQLWREGTITNWEYLTHLNKMAGRSYNDLMQYPVYPFVLSDYTSSTLDLRRPAVYRNFKKPMAVQDKKNEQHYINNYNELLGGLRLGMFNREPYHYGSHYSNSGTVLHFLVRLPPFTKMMLQYQDRNFDLPDRTFHSIHTTWRLASSESTTDVKEMLPEFFFLPEFLLNFQGFNFGIRQNGEIVSDVQLPPWCGGNARRFILIHRQALESDFVTENLPHWIDLVFGYKQTGKAAVDAINVFHPATYCGFNVDAAADAVERTAWKTMVKTYGQTPKQLFKTPHPFVVQSLVSNSDSVNKISGEVEALKWGRYVGSPVEPEPNIIWRQQCKGKGVVATLLPLATNDVLGLQPFTTPILHYNKEKGLGLVNAPGVKAALISWGHSDGIVRLKMKKELPMLPLVYFSHLDPVTVCTSVPGCDHLWMGHSSGNLTVYKFKCTQDRENVEFSHLPVLLQGHRKAVTHVTICRAYSVAVTAGQDGLVIIWDLNNVSYVRSFNSNSGAVRIVAVSDTLGDIASVSQPGDKVDSNNILHLHSINADFISSVTIKETVTSVSFSTAAEGISVNVVACGLHNGTIRLFSSWDLMHVRDISSPSLTHSVLSLAYSNDSQHLYASFRDGTVVAWESSASKYGIKTPKFFHLKL